MLYLVRHGLERELAASELRPREKWKKVLFDFSFESPHPLSRHDLPVRRPAGVAARAVQFRRVSLAS